MGTLYIVTTPIGNRNDITIRAIKTLFSSDFIYCEDTRKTGNLLQFYKTNFADIVPMTKKPLLISYFEGNEKRRIPKIINKLRENKKIALVSNAGTPLISDPGFKLVRECLKENIKVVSIPGPCAAITALTSSGLPTDKFLFLGYLPKKTGKKEKLFQSISRLIEKNFKCTIIFYASPFRLVKTLKIILQVFGDIEIVTARELTKIHEEIRKEKISHLLDLYSRTKLKGEFTFLFHPHKNIF